MAGRRSKFTKATKDKILDALSIGASIQMACDAACISRTTFYSWMNEGRKQEKGSYRTFFNNVNKHSAAGGLYMLQLITVAAEKDWKAAAWKLERRWGYNKEGAAAEEQPKPVEAIGTDTLQILREQAQGLKTSIAKAETAQSWQAYAALQRQFLNVVTQIMQIENELNSGDDLDFATDEQLLQEITNAIITLPPVLRQQLEQSITSLNNVVSIKEKP